MFNAWTIDQLQRAGAFLGYKRTLQVFAQRTFFLGLLFIGIGFLSLEHIFGALPMFIIGTWLILYAAAMLFLPPDKAFRVGDISGIIAFIVNSSFVLYEFTTQARETGQLPRALPSIFILIIAFGFIHFTYKRAVKSAPPTLGQHEEKRFAETMASFLKADMRTDETLITFKIDKTVLKGGLYELFAVITANKGQEVSIFTRHQLEIAPQDPQKTQKNIPVKVRAGQQWVTGTIDTVSFERYKRWKSQY